jgi:hypothetical protein
MRSTATPGHAQRRSKIISVQARRASTGRVQRLALGVVNSDDAKGAASGSTMNDARGNTARASPAHGRRHSLPKQEGSDVSSASTRAAVATCFSWGSGTATSGDLHRETRSGVRRLTPEMGVVTGGGRRMVKEEGWCSLCLDKSAPIEDKA